jgi:hypothetical protein
VSRIIVSVIRGRPSGLTGSTRRVTTYAAMATRARVIDYPQRLREQFDARLSSALPSMT